MCIRYNWGHPTASFILFDLRLFSHEMNETAKINNSVIVFCEPFIHPALRISSVVTIVCTSVNTCLQTGYNRPSKCVYNWGHPTAKCWRDNLQLFSLSLSLSLSLSFSVFLFALAPQGRSTLIYSATLTNWIALYIIVSIWEQQA